MILELSADWLPGRRLEGRVLSMAGFNPHPPKKQEKARHTFACTIMKLSHEPNINLISAQISMKRFSPLKHCTIKNIYTGCSLVVTFGLHFGIEGTYSCYVKLLLPTCVDSAS